LDRLSVDGIKSAEAVWAGARAEEVTTMLSRLQVQGFKSLEDIELEFPRLTVLFGPNTSGKSNLLEAILALSRLGISRTVSEALSAPIRGYPIEMFNFPREGLAGLLKREESGLRLEVDLTLESERERFRYAVEIQIQSRSGNLVVTDEYLTALTAKGEPRGNASLQRVDGQIRIRRKSKPAPPREEPCGLNHTLLSDPRLSGPEYRAIERCRQGRERWRIYYLDPGRHANRQAAPRGLGDWRAR
jgi:hypothetical protein